MAKSSNDDEYEPNSRSKHKNPSSTSGKRLRKSDQPSSSSSSDEDDDVTISMSLKTSAIRSTSTKQEKSASSKSVTGVKKGNTTKKGKKEVEVATEMKKKIVKVVNVTKKEKKMYSLPGQKHDPPNERDPLRIFYETLYDQLPNSEMAAFWMMERGLLEEDVAREIYENKLKKSGQQRVGTPVKVMSVKKSETKIAKRKSLSYESDTKKTSKKRKSQTSDSDGDDFEIIKTSKKRKTGQA